MEKRYMISDASRMVEVESHVLRYWEEELNIEVPRNEMGHRYYTDYHINLFRAIKCLKDRGFLLRAIKMVLPEIIAGKDPTTIDFLAEDNSVPYILHKEVPTYPTAESKMEQFQEIIGNIVTKAIIDNNERLSESVSSNVSTSVIKEMDYLLRLKEEREEEHFKKLDEAIRNCQKKSKNNRHHFFIRKKAIN
jgi:DNA-binding transcriptional MerR regulator